MLELGIDEYTIVLQLPSHLKAMLSSKDWMDVAHEIIIRKFCDKSRFNEIFGEELLMTHGLPEGYTHGFTYGEHGFYLAVAFHQYRADMGVVVKFSAQALDYYCKESGLKPYQFIQLIQDKMYTTRLSRVDFTVDYIDEDINVTDIYNDLIHRRVGLFREIESKKNQEIQYRRVNMQLRGIVREDEVPTVYLGSAKSNSRIRIYDKKREQIERKGTYYEKARICSNWIRFEGVFRNNYAHQISDALLQINGDDEYADLIACTMIQKYRFMYIDNGVVDCETEYTQMLLDYIKNGVFLLRSASSRNYELLRSILYIFSGSGVLATLYKIKMIWDDDSVKKLLMFLYSYLDEYDPNYDCKYWLRKNQSDYSCEYSDFDQFLKENLYPVLS